jgi:hypothetical protein
MLDFKDVVCMTIHRFFFLLSFFENLKFIRYKIDFILIYWILFLLAYRQLNKLQLGANIVFSEQGCCLETESEGLVTIVFSTVLEHRSIMHVSTVIHTNAL